MVKIYRSYKFQVCELILDEGIRIEDKIDFASSIVLEIQ